MAKKKSESLFNVHVCVRCDDCKTIINQEVHRDDQTAITCPSCGHPVAQSRGIQEEILHPISEFFEKVVRGSYGDLRHLSKEGDHTEGLVKPTKKEKKKKGC